MTREHSEPFSEAEREDLALSSYWNHWWKCPLCGFPVRDDVSAEAAARMGEHIAEHEADPDEAPQRSRQDFRLRGAR